MKTIRDEVNDRIEKILSDTREELASLAEKIQEGEEESQRQAAALNNAMKASDLAAYEKAKAAKNKADNAVEMYTKRTDMLKAGELISEEDSDAVLDSMIDYRRETWDKYRVKVSEMVAQLQKMQKEYTKEQDAIQLTIDRWTHEIHANHRFIRSGLPFMPSIKDSLGANTNREIKIIAPDDNVRTIVDKFIIEFRARGNM